MSNTSQGIFSCRGICWIVGALIGLVVWIIIGGIWGLLVAIAVAIGLALVLHRLFCTEYVDTREKIAGTTGAGAAAAGTAPSGATTGADTARKAGDAEAAREAAEAARAREVTDAEAARSAAEAEAEAARQTAQAEAARKAAEAEAAQAKADAEADAALAAMPEPGAKDYDGDGVIEGEGEGSRPEALTAARGGQADDLKLIKGIGPKLEQLCNELGFYHWDQIANWSADEVAWVNANLKGFKGRVSRDNWVEQAKTLAAGGSTEFAQRAEKSGLYDDKKS